MPALVLVTLAALAETLRRAGHGDFLPVIAFAFALAVYAVTWAADRLTRHDEREAGR